MRSKSVLVVVSVAAVILAVELLLRFLPVYDFAGPQEYFLHKQGQLLKHGTTEYETILFGDSRSMSLAAPVGTTSFYNFSVPGMGAAHYWLSLQLYLESNRRPKTVMLAALQHSLLSGEERPAVDLHYDSDAAPLTAILQMARYRLNQPFISNEQTLQSKAKQSLDQQFAGAFSNARLHYLGFFDSIRMYRGADTLMQSYEATPVLYRSYFLRSAIKAVRFKQDTKPVISCNSCKEIYAGLCADESPRDANQRVEKYRQDGHGSFNLDNLTTPSGRLALHLTRDQAISDLAKQYDSVDTEVETAKLERIVKLAADNDIEFVYVELPLPKRMSEGRRVLMYREAVKQLLSHYKNTQYIAFPNLSYDEDLFIDPLHLSCIGGEKLNQDWNALYTHLADRHSVRVIDQ